MSEDGYRRGRQVDRHEKEPEVSGLYRPIIPVVWGIGVVILLVVFGSSVQGALAVIVVTHLFFAGLIRGDIKSLRNQGVEWGLSRHLWFGAALGLPFVAPAYYIYSGRVIRRENAARGYGPDDGEVDGDPVTTDTADPADRTDPAETSEEAA